jgi:O-antigen/teichoic acid export membrane protein
MGLGFIILTLTGVHIDADAAAWLFVAGVALPVGFLAIVMIRARLFATAPAGRRMGRLFRAMALPLMAVSALTALIGDVAVVASGIFLSAAELGVFALALKIALLVGFLVQSIHQIAMPRIAAQHSLRANETARAEVIRTNRAALALALAAAFGIAALIPALQPWLGAEFADAWAVLLVLMLTQLVRIYLGPAVPALVLVAANGLSSTLSFLTFIALLGATALLAPRYGELGAALALSIAMLIWSTAAALVSAKRGLNTAGFGLRRSTPFSSALPAKT